MFSQTLFVLAALSVSVYAQGSSSTSAPAGTPSISPCILGCIIPAANQNGCSGITDLACLCTNAQFQVDALGCLQENCPSEVDVAVGLQQAQCVAASLTPTATATPTPSPVSFSPPGGSSSASPVSGSSSSSVTKPSVSSSASQPSGSVSATGAGTSLRVGALPYFCAVFAGVLAL